MARKTPSEVNASTLKAWWKNDEASGSRTDYSGIGNTLTDNNTVTAREGFRAARSAYFNSASSEYLSITDASQVGLDPYDSATGKYTVWGEIKLDSLASNYCWYSKYDDPNYGLMIYITSAGRIDAYVNSGALTASSATGVISAGKKHDIAVTFDTVSDLIIFYVDGFCVGRVTWTGTFLSTSTAPVRLGTYYASLQAPFNGQMGWTAVWADALTLAEVMSLSTISDIFGRDQGSYDYLRKTASSQLKIAQNFDPKVTGYFDSAYVDGFKNGSPTGNIWATVETDSAGAPSGTAVATSENIDVSLIHTSKTEVCFRFNAQFQLTSGSSYWLVLQGDYTPSTTGFLVYDSTASSGNYTGGNALAHDGTSWGVLAAQPTDISFRLGRVVGNVIDSHFLEAGTSDGGELYSNGNHQAYAQNIKFTSAKSVKGVAFWLAQYGDPTGTLSAKLYSNNAGVPGTLLATSASFNRNIGWKTATPSTYSNGGLWYLEFATAQSLTANTEYWIVMEASAGGSGANYNRPAFTSGSGYTATYDQQKYLSGSWSTYSAGYDLQFALFEEVAQASNGNFFALF